MKNGFFRYLTIYGILLIPVLLCSQELKWLYKIGSLSTDYTASVALDNSQNIYDVTNFTGTASISSTTSVTSRGQEDIIIRKSSPNGIQQWIRQLGGKSQDIANDIVCDNQNNTYIIGTFRDTLLLESASILHTQTNLFGAFILKLNSNGALLWAKKIESERPITVKSVTFGPMNDIVITGSFEGLINFPDSQSLITKGGSDIYVLKMNEGGNLMFLKQIGGVDQDFVSQHIVDTENNIFITGDFRASVDFDPNSSEVNINSKGLTDIYLLKLSSSGAFLWVKSFGSSNVDYGHSIAVDKDKNIILTGRFSETASFGTITQTLQSKGGTDIFLLKMNKDGITQWANSYGDINNDVPSHVIVNNKDVIYLSGTFRNKVDFDPSPIANFSDSNGGADGFVVLYNQDGTYNEHFSFGGIANEQINKIALKSNGEIITVGGFGAIVDFDPRQLSELNILSSGGLDAFMVNTFVCVNPYLKELRVSKSEICFGENAFMQVVEGYLNDATQWSWQRDKCDNLTFAAGTFLNLKVQNNTSFFVKGWGGCVLNDECKKIDIKVFKDTLRYQFIELCEGDTVRVGTKAYTTTGVYRDSLKSVSGCDSLIITEILTKKSYKFTNNYLICPGDTVKVGNSKYTFAGTYTNVFKAITGCDSTIISIVSVKPTNIQTLNFNLCEGKSLIVDNVTYTSGGTFIQESSNPNGCKDLKIINIKVVKRDFTNQKIICFGDSIKIGNKTYTTAGTYKDTLVSSLGCDSIITTILEVKSQSSSTNFYTICEGDSIKVGTNVYKSSGNYIDNLKNIAGCDSTVLSGITVIPKIPNVLKSYSICEGDSVKVGSKIYKIQGVFLDTLSSSKGCDSIITTNLTVFKRNNIINVSICKGDTINFGNSKLAETGVYTLPFKNFQGCDSIVSLNLTVKEHVTKAFTYNICPGDSVAIKGVNYRTQQMLSFKFKAQNGCDSIEIHEIRFNHVTNIRNFSICKGDSVLVNGKAYRNEGIFSQTFRKSDGCDSVLQINVKVEPTWVVDTIFEICKGGNIVVGSTNYLNPGNFIENLRSSKGCDSTVRFELRVTNFIPAVFVVRDTLTAFVISGAKYQWYECSANGTRIPFIGATQPSFPLFRNGKYSLGITFRGCTYFSDCLDYIRSSTQELPESIVKVYPNPMSEFVQINSEKDVKLKIFDIQGVLKGSYDVHVGGNEIFVGMLSKGIHIFEISDNNNNKLYLKKLKL